VTINGESLINRIIRIALDTQPAQTLLILGHEADEIYASLNHKNVDRVDCADWHTGMGASLRAGIQRVDAKCDGALILLCDQPALSTSHLLCMINAWHQQPERAVASAYANTVGVPALLPKGRFANLLSVRGDQGAREWLRNDPNVIRIDAPELVRDVDTAEDLPADFA
jgi:CTP:molybdopterin cytidylyltransferase MocA